MSYSTYKLGSLGDADLEGPQLGFQLRSAAYGIMSALFEDTSLSADELLAELRLVKDAVSRLEHAPTPEERENIARGWVEARDQAEIERKQYLSGRKEAPHATQ